MAWASAPPASSACRSSVSCWVSAAPCWSSWLLARLRSLISSATLVSSWAAKVRATAACERSCTTTRKPSATAMRLITISRCARAVPSAERLSILHQEGGVVGRDAECGAAQPAEAEPVDAVTAFQLRQLVGIAQALCQAGRIAERLHGVRSGQAAGGAKEDVDAGVVEGRARHHPLPVDGDRLRPALPEYVVDILLAL